MKPDKIYIQEGAILRTENTYDNDVCYVRKDIVDDTIATAEDHAYFAGKEKMREELLEFVNKKLQESADRLDFRANQAYAEVFDKLNSM